MNRQRFALAALAISAAVIAISQGPPPIGRQTITAKFNEISLERTPCFGACPVYKVTLKPDGTVRFHGTRFVDKPGDYEGKVDPEDVAKVVVLAEKLGFWNLKDKYTANITDMPGALVTIDTGEKEKTTNNYADQGPAELWAIEQLIDSVNKSVREWKKVD